MNQHFRTFLCFLLFLPIVPCLADQTPFEKWMDFGALKVELIAGAYTSNYIYPTDSSSAAGKEGTGKLFNDHQSWLGISVIQNFNQQHPNAVGFDLVFRGVSFSQASTGKYGVGRADNSLALQDANAFLSDLYLHYFLGTWGNDQAAPFVSAGIGGTMINATAIQNDFATHWYVGLGLSNYSDKWVGSFSEIAFRRDELYPNENRLWMRGRLLYSGEKDKDIIGYFIQGEAFVGKGPDEARILLGLRFDLSTLSKKVFSAP